MIFEPQPPQDSRQIAKIADQVLARRLGYVTEWQPREKTPGHALAYIFSRYLRAVLQRLNQAPEKNKLAFLDLLGLCLVPAQEARAPIVFQLNDQVSEGAAPAGTAVSAPPPPGVTNPITFETEQAAGLTAGKLVKVVSLWPGRDEYVDHSGDFLAGEAIQLFDKSAREPTPHHLYLSHSTLLALAGQVTINVEFELTQPGSERLDLLWEYWDGEVWRGFRDMNPLCQEGGGPKLDSTEGLTRSGRFVLISDCAESAEKEVNGISGFWIRGRTDEALLPGAPAILPAARQIRLSAVYRRALEASLASSAPRSAGEGAEGLVVAVRNEAGKPIGDAQVTVTDPDDAASPPFSIKTTSEGSAEFQGVPFGPRYEFLVSLADLDASTRSVKAPTANESRIDLDLSVKGLSPDQGFAANTEVDFSNPFYPLGLLPRPGSAFYFTNEEVFSKPNAEVRIYMAPTVSPEDETTVSVKGKKPAPLDHTLVWEYWNGRQWVALLQSSRNDSPKADFTETEVIELTVPVDMVPTTVNDVEALWMRVRLLSGTFGFKQQVVWNSGAAPDLDVPSEPPVINVVASAVATPTNLFTYVITQPPVLANFVLGYTWEDGPKHADRVLAYNDFEYRDYTDAARWPGSAFAPYRRVDDITPSLYLGFDKNFPDDRIGIYFDILEQRDDTKGPALIWEYWKGSTWRKLSVEDETSFLRLPGIVSFIASDDSRARPRFGEDLHFVRARLQHDGPPGEPTVHSIYPNAVWASQRQTLNDVPLGASSGLPDQVFLITQTPVLAGEQIEVRELFGPRANVEWRSLALNLTGGDRSAIRDLEAMLGREGAETNFVKGKLHLRRDRNKRVAEVWVRWDGQPHLYFSEPEDRHYVIDRAAGRLLFGDGTNGRIPPSGAAILAKQFRSGGGAAGNVEARKIAQMLGAVPGVEAIFNPVPAEGGADGETLEAFTRRGPQTVRHRGRAITPSDYETLAREASPAVAFVRAIPARDAAGNRRQGQFNLLIIPQSEDPRPQPSNGLRQHVQRFIERRAPADLVGCAGISVTGPDYLPVGIDAVIAPRLPSEAGQVERRARLALQVFFHPLRGGPAGRGWELGRDVFLSDVAAVLEAVEGLDYVEELALHLNGAPQGERVKVAEDRIVVAGGIELTVRVAER